MSRTEPQRLADVADGVRAAHRRDGRPDPVEQARETAELPVPLNLRALAHRDPEPPAFIVADWLPAGEVTLFAGHGGAGKSQIGITLSASLGLGRDWYGLPSQPRRVAYLSLEDPAPVLHWRLARICAWLGADLAALADRLIVWDGSAIDGALMTETRDGALLTHVYAWLAERVRSDGVQVLVIDGASDAFGGNEIARAQVRRFVRALRRLIPADGAVVLLAHVDKATARAPDTSQGYSGSTAWSNSCRARWYLRPADDGSDELLLEVQKTNHASPGQSMRLRWNAEAHVFVRADADLPASRLDREMAEIDERGGILEALKACEAAGIVVPAATTGQRTAYHVLRAQPAFPARLKGNAAADRRRFWDQIERLRAMGAVREMDIRRADRHKVAALVVAPEGARACGQ